MKKKTLQRILQVTVVLTISIILIFLLFDINIFTKEGIIKIPTIITIVVTFWLFYFSYGWKWPIIKNIVPKENINGTWYGKYTSTDFTTNKIYKGNIVLVIRQTFLKIDVKSFTNKYINYSFGEALNYDSKSDTNQLIYLYSQSEFNPINDSVRKGTSELKLEYNSDTKFLFGDFWTNHNSKGNLNFEKVTGKHVKSFADAKKYLK